MAPLFCNAAKRSLTSMGCALSRRRLCSTSSVVRTWIGASLNGVLPSLGVLDWAFSACIVSRRLPTSSLGRQGRCFRPAALEDAVTKKVLRRAYGSCGSGPTCLQEDGGSWTTWKVWDGRAEVMRNPRASRGPQAGAAESEPSPLFVMVLDLCRELLEVAEFMALLLQQAALLQLTSSLPALSQGSAVRAQGQGGGERMEAGGPLVALPCNFLPVAFALCLLLCLLPRDTVQDAVSADFTILFMVVFLFVHLIRQAFRWPGRRPKIPVPPAPPHPLTDLPMADQLSPTEMTGIKKKTVLMGRAGAEGQGSRVGRADEGGGGHTRSFWSSSSCSASSGLTNSGGAFGRSSLLRRGFAEASRCFSPSRALQVARREILSPRVKDGWEDSASGQIGDASLRRGRENGGALRAGGKQPQKKGAAISEQDLISL